MILKFFPKFGKNEFGTAKAQQCRKSFFVELLLKKRIEVKSGGTKI